jgi:hypothetical protein
VKLINHLLLVPRSKNACNYTSIPQYVFMVRCLVKHRENFTFTFYYSSRGPLGRDAVLALRQVTNASEVHTPARFSLSTRENGFSYLKYRSHYAPRHMMTDKNDEVGNIDTCIAAIMFPLEKLRYHSLFLCHVRVYESERNVSIKMASG